MPSREAGYQDRGIRRARRGEPFVDMITLALLAFPLLAAPPGESLLSDFRGGGIPLRWRSVNDNVMGGRSLGSFVIEDGVLTFSGSLNTNGGGFASIRAGSRSFELGAAEGIVLRVKGDGREYSVRLRESSSRVSYRAEFRTRRDSAGWQEVWLPFKSFVPTWRGRRLDRRAVEPAGVEEIGISIADKIDGAFRLQVDSMRAYAPFSIDAYRWKARPLLLFAPSADDEELVRQLAAVRRQTQGFLERDMVLIVVLGDGTAYAGTRPIDAAPLRERFAGEDSKFLLKLIGKDGSAKRTSREPLAMRKLFDQIDAMPMRRAEMQSRR